ncbi:MAG TPA: hypothetical protein PLZ44_09625 [Methanothrix sp.]|nr:hypothetical protein [Methanothrix sp.]
MRLLAIVLIFAVLQCVNIVSAATDDEINAYAAGVLAATDSKASATIGNERLIVGRVASEYELEDQEMALFAVYQLAKAANIIALHFPGRFNESMGLLLSPTGEGDYVAASTIAYS